MLSLMLKDMYLLRKTMAFSAFYLILMLFVFSKLDNSIAVFTSCTVAITYLLMVSGCALDDKNKSDVILNSLPLSRYAIVGEKYLMVIIYVLLGAAVYSIGAWAVGLLNLLPNVFNLTLEGLLAAFLAVSFLASIYLPIYFKFGYIKSRIYHFILFFGLFFGINLLVSIVPEDSPFVSRLLVFLARLNGAAAVIILTGATLAILAVSYGISLKIYKNREF